MAEAKISGSWRPATVDEVKAIVREDLSVCPADRADLFRRYTVDEYEAPIVRYGLLEHVVVVARRGDEVMYWEDVEEGFNISPIGADGIVLEHWCNQHSIAQALGHWIEDQDFEDMPDSLTRV